MKTWTWAAALLAAGSLTAAGVEGGSLRATREIIYPTEYESQEVGDQLLPARPPGPSTGVTPAVRPPVPTAFETREVGAMLDTGGIGVTRAVTIANRMTYVARFHNGALARFMDGLVTVVDGVPYRALGPGADGTYHVRNLDTGRVHRFRMNGQASRRAAPVPDR